MIISCGEALIDFVPVKTTEGHSAYRPLPGGSLFNVACALGRLGARVGLMGGLSTDLFGDMLLAALKASHVDTGAITRLDRPTTLGFVSLDEEEPRYAFYDAIAADREWPGPQAPIPAEVTTLHFGSLALLREPAAAAYEALALTEAGGRRLISLDPNIRAGMVRDAAAYRARLDRMVAAAHLVKVSRADLAWIAPGRALDDVAGDWLARGPSLVVITSGADGATAYRLGGRLTQPAEPVPVIDTVGAGDSFMAGLLAGLDERGALTPETLTDAPEAALRHAMALAQRTAAITCTHAGADAPWRSELGELAE